MKSVNLSDVVVGNEFLVPQPSLPVAAPAPAPAPAAPISPILEEVEFEFEATPRQSILGGILELLHRYSLGAFALLFLVVGVAAIEVAATYRSSQITLTTSSKTSLLRIPATPKQGPNIIVTSNQLADTVQRIGSQPLDLMVGDKPVPIGSERIKSWLQIVSDNRKGVAYIHLNQSAISKSIEETAAPYVKTPANQVSISHDGSSQVVVAGRNGTKLGDISGLAKQIGPNVLSAKGMQLPLPMETVNFAALTPADFDKLIEVNVVTKQMYLYEKGQVSRTYPISAGAPSTPTPIGQFKIFSKPAVQDMKGFNPDGSKYFQPHVRWINYFLPGGYGIHGNYWRPASWFGAINSSHGCVSLPDEQAKQVYDWAPIGTTVITHT